jgi:hypothetical protein
MNLRWSDQTRYFPEVCVELDHTRFISRSKPVTRPSFGRCSLGFCAKPTTKAHQTERGRLPTGEFEKSKRHCERSEEIQIRNSAVVARSAHMADGDLHNLNIGREDDLTKQEQIKNKLASH